MGFPFSHNFEVEKVRMGEPKPNGGETTSKEAL
jgi:hypothetical protein